MTKKKIIIAVLLCAFVAIGIYGYRAHRQNTWNEIHTYFNAFLAEDELDYIKEVVDNYQPQDVMYVLNRILAFDMNKGSKIGLVILYISREDGYYFSGKGISSGLFSVMAQEVPGFARRVCFPICEKYAGCSREEAQHAVINLFHPQSEQWKLMTTCTRTIISGESWLIVMSVNNRLDPSNEYKLQTKVKDRKVVSMKLQSKGLSIDCLKNSNYSILDFYQDPDKLFSLAIVNSSYFLSKANNALSNLRCGIWPPIGTMIDLDTAKACIDGTYELIAGYPSSNTEIPENAYKILRLKLKYTRVLCDLIHNRTNDLILRRASSPEAHKKAIAQLNFLISKLNESYKKLDVYIKRYNLSRQ